MPVRISELAVKTRLVGAEASLSAVLQLFLSDPDCNWLTVVKDRRPAGLLRRAGVMELAASSDETVLQTLMAGELIDVRPLRIDGRELAAKLALDHQQDGFRQLLNGAMVTDGRRYIGVLTLPSLLKAVSTENAARAHAMKNTPTPSDVARDEPADTGKAEPKSVDTQFLLATLAHEVRTPLTGMMGLAELLAGRVDDPGHRDIAETIVRSGDALDRILKDTLDYVSLESGVQKVSPEPSNLNRLVEDLRQLWSAQSSRRGLSLHVGLSADGTHLVDVDLGKVQQVANNLISNALKFTANGGVSVTIGTQALGTELMLSVEVSDTGRGIGEADKARLFEAFEKGERISDAPGWGLGLAISHSLSRHLGGGLSLANNPGGGSVFTLMVPVNASVIAPAEAPKTMKSGSFSLGDVLVVEDHEACAMIVIDALNNAGWTVHHAPSLRQAEDMLSMQSYQALLTDLHLADGSALTMIEKIRRREDPATSTPILAMTADISAGTRQACLAVGADRALSKPIQGPALVATLADVLMARAAGSMSLPQLRGRLAS